MDAASCWRRRAFQRNMRRACALTGNTFNDKGLVEAMREHVPVRWCDALRYMMRTRRKRCCIRGPCPQSE